VLGLGCSVNEPRTVDGDVRIFNKDGAFAGRMGTTSCTPSTSTSCCTTSTKMVLATLTQLPARPVGLRRNKQLTTQRSRLTVRATATAGKGDVVPVMGRYGAQAPCDRKAVTVDSVRCISAQVCRRWAQCSWTPPSALVAGAMPPGSTASR
jgi:hypothetical protein